MNDAENRLKIPLKPVFPVSSDNTQHNFKEANINKQMQHSFLILSILSLQRCSAFVNPKPLNTLIPFGHSFHVLKSTEDVDDGQGRNSGNLESFSHPSNGVDKDESNIVAFEADITTVIKEARAAEDTTFYPLAFANSKSHLSISVVWDLEMWRKHTNRMRYLRYTMCTFSSRLLKRICPQLIPFVAWSFFYVFVAAKRTNLAKGDVIPLNSLSLVSTFVAFLLTLRSNQGLARLSEGRNLFGRAFIVTRDTSQLLATYVYPKDKKLGLTAARYLSLFAWLLKGGLRDTSDSDIIAIMLPSKSDNTYLDSHRKKPAACISRIRQVVATLASRNELPVAAHQQLETNLNEMNYVLVSQTCLF